MPVHQICVCPPDKKESQIMDDKEPSDASKQAMLQSIVSTYPPSVHNGSSPNSSPSSAYDMCRICHCEAEVDAPLIAPCICSGSLRYVHQACLQQWIKSSDTKKCELCKFEFKMQTKTKPFREWDRLEMSSVERRKIFCSVTFHVVAITCVVWSLYVLIDRTAEEMKTGALEWPFWTKLIVVAIGFTGGLVFMYVQCKMYVQLCRRWRVYNRIIFVENAPPKTSVISGSTTAANNTTTAATTTPATTAVVVVTNSGSSPTSNTVSVCLEPCLPVTSIKVETRVSNSTNGTGECVIPANPTVVVVAASSTAHLQSAAQSIASTQVPPVVVSATSPPIRCQVSPELLATAPTVSPDSPNTVGEGTVFTTTTATTTARPATLISNSNDDVDADSTTVVREVACLASSDCESAANVHSQVLQRIP